MAHIRFNRCSEVLFRANVPCLVNSLHVLEVLGYQPGGSGVYASAFALTQLQPGTWATHHLVCVDDNPIGEINWSLSTGHYDFLSRESAFADLVSRTHYGNHVVVQVSESSDTYRPRCHWCTERCGLIQHVGPHSQSADCRCDRHAIPSHRIGG
jgi:hypothetical protein